MSTSCTGSGAFEPNCDPITIKGKSYKLVAFYYPGHCEPWDDFYKAPFLGNFWECSVTFNPPGMPSATFHTSEAAFQSTKWWDNPVLLKKFENAKTGGEAFSIKKSAGPPSCADWAGMGRIGAMKAILEKNSLTPCSPKDCWTRKTPIYWSTIGAQ